MAKGGRRKGGANKKGQQSRRQSGHRPPAPRRQPATPRPPPQADNEQLYEEAQVNATAEDKAALTDEPTPDGTDLGEEWNKARRTYDLLNTQRDRYAKLVGDLAAQEECLKSKEADVAASKHDLEDQASKLEEQRKGLGERREALDARESELQAHSDELEKKRRELDGRERRLRWDEEDIEKERADLPVRVEQRVATEVASKHEEYEHRTTALSNQLKRAQADRDQLQKHLAEREEADRRLGQRNPEELIKTLDALQREKDRLDVELAERPDAGAAQRLNDLAREQQSWQRERSDLTLQLTDLKRRLAYADKDVGEREAHRDRIASLVSQQELLRRANEELRTEVRELISDRGSQSIFPTCTALDQDQEAQYQERTESIGNLKDLVAYVRDHMASADQPLYYSEADVRSFIGGLAMGRLILLQGISGTGKTSLPIAFARAVGTRAYDIKVQAGWRDPQDLIGHYNAFEKRFHEKEFLRALYRAGTPRWEDTIQIVLLDEMNLSSPEQYFSDMLSALEQPDDRQALELMTHTVATAPSRLEDGRLLAIPPNVWFVGTANHDETTMNFADKTYDRAHVMEFPHRPEVFDAEPPGPRHRLSFNAFRQAVDAAVRTHAERAESLRRHIEDNLRRRLADHFDIGWGPRLEQQMSRYVPVVIAAGGTAGEAGDHLLAMRLLRKLKDRHNNRPEHLEALKRTIEDSWFDGKGPPTKSVRLLDRELARSGLDPESEA